MNSADASVDGQLGRHIVDVKVGVQCRDRRLKIPARAKIKSS